MSEEIEMIVYTGDYKSLRLKLPWYRTLWWRLTRGTKWIKLYAKGCCTTCQGTGIDASAPETNGKCWDCEGTGHMQRGHGLGEDCASSTTD